MRTSVVKNEKIIFSFKMTDDDVVRSVDECNALRSEEQSLERKKKLIQQEMKKIQTVTEEKLNNIVNRLEPREVDCCIVFDYENRMVTTDFKGEIMESRKMSDWEYTSRPEDIYPEIKRTVVENRESITDFPASFGETEMEKAFKEADERAEEIKAKQELNQVPSANVNTFSEAKTEKSVCTPANLDNN